VRRYAKILRAPGVARVLFSQLTARFPFGMLSIAFLVFAERTYNSYAVAGAVLGAMSLGNAVAGPISSRLLGVWGIRQVVMGTILICSATLTVMAFAPMPSWVMMALGVIAGATYPPVQSAVRTIYPAMVEDTQINALYSLDAAAQEIIWIIGPVMTTFVSIQINAVLGIMLAVAFFIFGGLWFITSPAVASVQLPRSNSRFGAVLRRPLVSLNTVIGLLLVASFAAAEAGIIAVFGDGNSQSGFVLGIWAFGSLIGGLALGHRRTRPFSTAQYVALSLAGLALALFSTDFWWLAATLLLSGIGVAPTLATLFATVTSSVDFSETPEAFGWLGTGQLIGAASGAAVAGIAIDHFGAHAALIVSALFMVLTLATAFVAVPWMPKKITGD